MKARIGAAVFLLAALTSNAFAHQVMNKGLNRPQAQTNSKRPSNAFAHPVMNKGLNPWTAADYMQNLSSYDSLNVPNIRVELVWNDIEPQRGQFDQNALNALDNFVSTANSHYARVLFTLRCISSWGTQVAMNPNDKYHGASAPKNMDEWTFFVKTLAYRYTYWVGTPITPHSWVDYEIENEVNSNFWAGTLNDYLNLLKSTYATIKPLFVTGGVGVLCSAMACGTASDLSTPAQQSAYFNTLSNWLVPILAGGNFNAVSVHNYYFPGKRVVNGQTFSSYLNLTRDLMRQTHMAHKPVWITEAGYVSQPVTVGSRTDNGSWPKQAIWLKQAHHEAATYRGLKVWKFYWLFRRDNLTIRNGYFSTMGLEDTNNTQKPSWAEFQVMR
jgi:hypothetical protein